MNETMYIAEILDDTSFVVVGAGVESTPVGTHLLVLAVAGKISGTTIPLVVPKAEVEVTTATGLYLIARPPEQTREESPAFAMLSSSVNPVKVRFRPQLAIDPHQKRGNPANAQIKIGDPVIRPADLENYVRNLASLP